MTIAFGVLLAGRALSRSPGNAPPPAYGGSGPASFALALVARSGRCPVAGVDVRRDRQHTAGTPSPPDGNT